MLQPTTTMGPRLQDLLGLWLSRRIIALFSAPRPSNRENPPFVSAPPRSPASLHPRLASPAWAQSQISSASRCPPLAFAQSRRAARTSSGSSWCLVAALRFCLLLFLGGTKGESSWQRETKKERKRRKKQRQWKQWEARNKLPLLKP